MSNTLKPLDYVEAIDQVLDEHQLNAAQFNQLPREERHQLHQEAVALAKWTQEARAELTNDLELLQAVINKAKRPPRIYKNAALQISRILRLSDEGQDIRDLVKRYKAIKLKF